MVGRLCSWIVSTIFFTKTTFFKPNIYYLTLILSNCSLLAKVHRSGIQNAPPSPRCRCSRRWAAGASGRWRSASATRRRGCRASWRAARPSARNRAETSPCAPATCGTARCTTCARTILVTCNLSSATCHLSLAFFRLSPIFWQAAGPSKCFFYYETSFDKILRPTPHDHDSRFSL